MTFAVLPHSTTITCDAMGAVVQILTVHAADRAIKIPFTILIRQLLQLLFVLLLLDLSLARRHTFGLVSGGGSSSITVRILGGCALFLLL